MSWKWQALFEISEAIRMNVKHHGDHKWIKARGNSLRQTFFCSKNSTKLFLLDWNPDGELLQFLFVSFFLWVKKWFPFLLVVNCRWFFFEAKQEKKKKLALRAVTWRGKGVWMLCPFLPIHWTNIKRAMWLWKYYFKDVVKIL